MTDFIEKFQINLHTGFTGNCQQMQDRVSGTADGHIHMDGIVESGLCHYITGFYISFQQFHHFHPRFFGQADAFGINRRDGTITGQSHPQGFGQAVHGISRKHTGTRSASGAGILLQCPQLPGIHFTSCCRSYRLKNLGDTDGLVIAPARQHRSAADENSRNIKAGCRH